MAHSQDWRKRLESQRGAVLAFETKNNKNKMAKWTASALLAGADMIKLGYVSRSVPRDNTTHIIRGTQVRAWGGGDREREGRGWGRLSRVRAGCTERVGERACLWVCGREGEQGGAADRG